MLIVSMAVRDYDLALQQGWRLSQQADAVELRLDYAQHWEINAVAQLRTRFTVPIIFTLRNVAGGGRYPHSESQRLETLLSLCPLAPDYLDLEQDVPHEFIKLVRKAYPKIKIIASYHNFAETPDDLTGVLQTLYPDVYAYKLATYAESILDALRMLQWLLAQHSQQRIIGLCMGEAGQCTRILAPVVGGWGSYAYWDQSIAPGQLSLQQLTSLYRYPQLNRATKIYALLGDPIQGSLGHIFHNSMLAWLGHNAVYVKLPVSAEILPEVMRLLRYLPMGGLSITMPHKAAVLPLVDILSPEAQAIQAVNTVVCQQQWSGWNTDGLGAIHALSDYGCLAEQTIVILGAGGAARSIAYAAVSKGAKVIVLNRTLAKACKLAQALGCDADDLTKFPTLTAYTWCINTLPNHAFQDPSIQAIWRPQHILPGTLVMDIVYSPLSTTCIQIAKLAGCRVISGFHMFLAQALLQIHHWFDH